MRAMIPNICTALNLFFGMCSILCTYEGDYFYGSVFIFIALVADGLDGRIARALGVASEFGKEMDSLCDLGSFGIAPAFLAYSFCLHQFGYIGKAAAIIFALCGMWRLARFNVNTNVVHGFFMGLAIPAGGCIVAATTLLFSNLNIQPANFGLTYPISIIIVAYLMVSHVHYPDFKSAGERIFLVSKICAAVIFVAILFFSQNIFGLLTAVFVTYAVFGIVNSLVALLNRDV